MLTFPDSSITVYRQKAIVDARPANQHALMINYSNLVGGPETAHEKFEKDYKDVLFNPEYLLPHSGLCQMVALAAHISTVLAIDGVRDDDKVLPSTWAGLARKGVHAAGYIVRRFETEARARACFHLYKPHLGIIEGVLALIKITVDDEKQVCSDEGEVERLDSTLEVAFAELQFSRAPNIMSALLVRSISLAKKAAAQRSLVVATSSQHCMGTNSNEGAKHYKRADTSLTVEDVTSSFRAISFAKGKARCYNGGDSLYETPSRRSSSKATYNDTWTTMTASGYLKQADSASMSRTPNPMTKRRRESEMLGNIELPSSVEEPEDMFEEEERHAPKPPPARKNHPYNQRGGHSHPHCQHASNGSYIVPTDPAQLIFDSTHHPEPVAREKAAYALYQQSLTPVPSKPGGFNISNIGNTYGGEHNYGPPRPSSSRKNTSRRSRPSTKYEYSSDELPRKKGRDSDRRRSSRNTTTSRRDEVCTEDYSDEHER